MKEPKYKLGQEVFWVDQVIFNKKITGVFKSKTEFFYTFKSVDNDYNPSIDDWMREERLFETKEDAINSLR